MSRQAIDSIRALPARSRPIGFGLLTSYAYFHERCTSVLVTECARGNWVVWRVIRC
jgi:hypothetical protein